jgi:hypothetical protein
MWLRVLGTYAAWSDIRHYLRALYLRSEGRFQFFGLRKQLLSQAIRSSGSAFFFCSGVAIWRRILFDASRIG